MGFTGVARCHVVLLLADTSGIAADNDVGFEGRGLTYSNGPSVDQNRDDTSIAFVVSASVIVAVLCMGACWM